MCLRSLEVQAWSADHPDDVLPARQLVEVAAPQRAALDPREQQRTRFLADIQRQVITNRGEEPEPSSSPPKCPARGHRVKGRPAGRRTRSATPTLDPVAAPKESAPIEEDGEGPGSAVGPRLADAPPRTAE